ncbi:MAG: glycosyltransferase [Minisyncoccia bacterium]|jgi:glycosyltransferase involved in cell wall biosynthesis
MKISFIIPTLNESKILERMVLSLRELKTIPYEIIVSDGGSTDETLAIAYRLADKVIEWKEPIRQNIAMGRNAGAREAAGNLLAFFDADVFIPDMDAFFSHVLRRFEDDPQLMGLIPRLNVLEFERTTADVLFLGFFNIFNRVMNNVLASPTAPGELQIIPAAAFKKVGGYDEHIVQCEDMDMFMKLGRIGKTRLDPELVAFQTCRRAHKVGWPRLVTQWTTNGFMVKFFNRSVHEEWEVIR